MLVLRVLRQALQLLVSSIMADVNSALACANAYTDIEEDFFRAGDELSSTVANDSFAAEREPQAIRTSIWSRLFERPLRLPTDDLLSEMPAPAPSPVAVRTRPPTERPAAEESGDEEWDWMLAIARARAATQPGM
jgi:hypothetical protein